MPPDALPPAALRPSLTEEGASVTPPPELQPTRLTRLDLSALMTALDRGERRTKGIEKPIPIPWPEYAAQLGGGLWPGLHVLVSGTGIGKTTLALQIGLAAALVGYPVCYIGLELDELQIALRVLGAQANLPWSSLYTGHSPREGEARADEQARLEVHVARAREAALNLAGPDAFPFPFYVEFGEPSGWPSSRLGVLAEAMRRDHPEPSGPGSLPMLLVCDFLQIVGDDPLPDGRPGRSDLRERIGRAAYQARAVARRYNAAMLCVSSTAREKYALLGDFEMAGVGVESDELGRVKRRVLLHRDALLGTGKESGEIEYAADTVTVALRWKEKLPERGTEGTTGIVLASPKVRHGGEGWCELRFNGHRFSEPDPEHGSLVAAALGRAAAAKAERRAPGDRRSLTPLSAPARVLESLEDGEEIDFDV